ncbi:MAG: Na(+)/H(+) antiporter subunit D [Pseudomonadota bacterium]
MIDFIIPPGLVLIVAGLLLPFLNRSLGNLLLVVAPLAALSLVWNLPDGNVVTYSYLGFELVPVRVDELARVFATVFTLMASVGALYASRQENTFELASAFVYAGAALGVLFAGDLITVFVFWEIMAIASTIVIWSGGSGARAAGQRYAAVHFLGGVLLMAGIAGEITANGSIAFNPMEADSWARWLILAGFLINAGAPPFTAWVADAYPEASWSGTVFLSAFTTKTAVYVLMRSFPGTELLIYIGAFMVFYAIIYALLENNIRRILAFSIVGQVGFMVIAIGIGTEVALNGAAAHAFVHILYKALLLMSAGAVIYQTGKHKCTDLGGLFRTMPITLICGTIGAFSLAAVPGTSGFITKGLITQGAVDLKLAWVWFALTAASASALVYVGLKFPWFVFFSKDSGLRPAEPPASMLIAMTILSAMCLLIGIFPNLLYDMLPYPVEYKPYSTAKLIFQLQLLLFSGLVFFLTLGLLKPTLTQTLDFDWFYRGLGKVLRQAFDASTLSAWRGLSSGVQALVVTMVAAVYRWTGPGGLFAESWTTGRMAFLTTVLLGLYLALYFA